MARLSWISIAFFVTLAFAFNTLALWDIEQSPAPAVRPQGGEGSLTSEQCQGACEVRCSATSHQQFCVEVCSDCCKKCLCVPSGTYGHKDECPCYRDLKTQEGAAKCP